MIELSQSLISGVVVDTADPQQMGRLKVWCPAIDGPAPDIELLPWATYITPFGGHAHSYQAGSRGSQAEGPVPYGFWAIPKIGAHVIVAGLYGDVHPRVYLGSTYRAHGNRGLPVGRNTAGAPVSDSEDPIEPQLSNLNAQFGGNLSASEARTRGAYERQVAQARTEKDGTEGYQERVANAEDKAGSLDPQTYCITTPGRHSIIFQDNPATARVRIKTADGSQIILDDANERIYISVARGNAYVELDRDGHVHVYSAQSISMSAGKDFNLQALGNINIAAGKNLNLSAGGHGRLSACSDVSISGDGGVNITSGATMNLLAAANLIETGAKIHLNGPTAATAPCADKPSIVPSHEPWTRPPSATPRGKNWKA